VSFSFLGGQRAFPKAYCLIANLQPCPGSYAILDDVILVFTATEVANEAFQLAAHPDVYVSCTLYYC